MKHVWLSEIVHRPPQLICLHRHSFEKFNLFSSFSGTRRQNTSSDRWFSRWCHEILLHFDSEKAETTPQQLVLWDKCKMDACWEASVRATTVPHWMLMSREVRCPAESLMCSSRWSYTGTHHLRSSFTLLHFHICTPRLSERFMCENATAYNLGTFFTLSPSSLSSPRGLRMWGYQHHRRPSGVSWSSPCQHRRGAERLAEFHTLVQASQRTLWACPRNASRPQPQSLALTGSRRGRVGKRMQLSSWMKQRWHTHTHGN